MGRQLKRKAFERYLSGIDKGILIHNAEAVTEAEIIEAVLEQEIISYCTSAGCVSFDINDLETKE